MKRFLCASVLTVACLAASATAQDAFQFLVDSRGCVASFGGDGGGSAYDSPRVPFADWQGGANIDVTNIFETWIANSSQISSLSGSRMSMISTAAASVVTTIALPIFSQGRNTFDVWFSVAAETTCNFTGHVGESGHPGSRASVSITREDGSTLYTAAAPEGGGSTFSTQVVFAPGTYRIVCESLARAQVPQGVASVGAADCSFLLTVTGQERCRSDVNGDGAVNSADFYDFVSDFMSGDADFDGDGRTTSIDFFGFIGNFLNDC